jgi:hypothetical protein
MGSQASCFANVGFAFSVLVGAGGIVAIAEGGNEKGGAASFVVGAGGGSGLLAGSPLTASGAPLFVGHAARKSGTSATSATEIRGRTQGA